MAVDPLSPATRATKRNLLVASMLAIIYRAFDVSIDKIPVAGLSISFDNRVFAFLLIATLLYMTTTFALYYFIDIRNLEQTPHQVAKQKNYDSARNSFWSNHGNLTLRKIQASLPEQVTINTNEWSTIASYFQQLENVPPGVISHPPIPRNFIVYRGNPHNAPKVLTRETDPAIFTLIDTHIDKAGKTYLKRRARHYRHLKFSLYAVRSLYFIRDYLVDGILPLVLALIAFAALFHLIDLQWLRNLMPMPPG
jgi:hypothetical protein